VTYRFCPKCASVFTKKFIGGRERLYCTQCQFVFYRNPVAGVAVIILEKDQILLARRARGAYKGAWCIPCGYVEWEEDVREAAQREIREETGLIIEVGPVYAVYSNFHDPEMHSVGIWFKGSIIGGILTPGDDVDEVEFVPLNKLPENIAFPTDRKVLNLLRQEFYLL
jgi:ADP-ribose pyrophosphatase YjhB (NUDIX family)